MSACTERASYIFVGSHLEAHGVHLGASANCGATWIVRSEAVIDDVSDSAQNMDRYALLTALHLREGPIQCTPSHREGDS
jgi:hypothetical protein